jgi:hypothetical protein
VATKTNPCFFEPAKRKSGCIQYDRPREHSLSIVHRLVLKPPAGRCNSSSTKQQSPQQLSSKDKTRTNLFHHKPQPIYTLTAGARNAQRSAKTSLVTFFGFGKKVTRLSTGIDGFDFKDFDLKNS